MKTLSQYMEENPTHFKDKLRLFYANIKDCDKIIKLEKELDLSLTGRKLLKFFIKSKNIILLKDYLKNEICGFLIYRGDCHEIEIINLGIKKQYHGIGYGKFLLKYLMKNFNEISLEVSIENVSAQRFYKSLGFRVISIRKNYYEADGSDALVLNLKKRNRLLIYRKKDEI